MAMHHTCRSRRGTLAFRTHPEARALWDAILHQVPDPMALCLMPDHVHLLHRRDVHQALGRALGSYARRRNGLRGQQGRVWQRQPPPDPVEGTTKQRRSERYIHLNPCRARLVADPLAWPWSTHRDRLGLAVPGCVPAVPDPSRFHAYVSADPTVHVNGTPLPALRDMGTMDGITAAVSALTRATPPMLAQRGPARSTLLRSLRCLSDRSPADLADALGLHRASLYRVLDIWTPDVRIVAQVLGDPRFAALQEHDLRHQPSWARYRFRP